MATRRIKDITNTATTFASDDFIALDGSTQGTRKMDKDDLISEISAGVSGDYLEEANNLSDVASLDTSKLNMEIPDVGTAPNEVPLNGMLGDMAFQSSDGVSMGAVSADGGITSTAAGTNTQLKLKRTESATGEFDIYTNTDKLYFKNTGDGGTFPLTLDGSKVGIGTSSPDRPLHSYASSVATALKLDSAGIDTGVEFAHSGTVAAAINCSTGGDLEFRTGANSSGNERLRIDSSGRVGIGKTPGTKLDVMETGDSVKADFTNNVNANFRIKTSGANTQIGPSTASNLELQTQNITRWTVHSSNGNLIASSGVGIDFGSVTTSAGDGTGTTGTVSNQVLSDYEYGSWTPTIAPSGGSFTSITMDVQSATYVKVGRMVHCQAYIRTDGLDTTGASGSVRVTGLPFVNSGSSNYAAVSVGLSRNWVTNPAGGYVNNGVASLTLTKRTTSSTELIEMEPADMTTGSGTDKNAVLMSFQYIAST